MASDLSQVTQPVDGRAGPPAWICCLPVPRPFSSSIFIWKEVKTPENGRGATLGYEGRRAWSDMDVPSDPSAWPTPLQTFCDEKGSQPPRESLQLTGFLVRTSVSQINRGFLWVLGGWQEASQPEMGR